MTQNMIAFSPTEYERRLELFRKQMDRIGADVAVLDQVESMVWLSGFTVGETMWRCCVVPRYEEPFLIVRSLDRVPAEETTWLRSIVGFRDWDNPLQVLVDELSVRGLADKVVGMEFESPSMPQTRFANLKTLLPKATFADFGSIFWGIRAIKSAQEIDYLRTAAELCDAGIAAAVKTVRVGGNQREITTAAVNLFLERGSDQTSNVIVTTGASWGALHGNESAAPIERGTIVHVELCPRINGYSSRIMRSIVVGAPTERQKEVAQTLIDLQDAQLAAIKPGSLARDIDAIVRDAVMARKLRPSYDNVTGYTLGCYPPTTQKQSEFVHCFTPNAEWTIQEGMTLHMYVSAEGLAFSESIVVRTNGVERLTKSERKLFQVEVLGS